MYPNFSTCGLLAPVEALFIGFKDVLGRFKASLLGVGIGTGILLRLGQGCVEAPLPLNLFSLSNPPTLRRGILSGSPSPY